MQQHRYRVGLFLLLVVIPGLLFGGFAIYWHIASGILDKNVALWIEDQRQAGNTLSYDSKSRQGFPFTTGILFKAPSLTRKNRAGLYDGGSWQAETVLFEADLLKPGHYTLSFSGKHRLTISSPSGPQAFSVDLQSGLAEVTTTLKGEFQYSIVSLEGLTATSEQDGTVTSLHKAQLTLSPSTDAGTEEETRVLEAALSLFDIGLPETVTAPLGYRIDRASLSLSLPHDLVSALTSNSIQQTLAAWRDAGGIFDIPWLAVNWGPLAIQGAGTATLDDQFRPLASFEMKANGYRETLDAFAEAGLLEAETARLAGLGLQIFTGLSGGGRTLAFPFTAQDAGLYLGPIRIGDNVPLIKTAAKPVLKPEIVKGRSEAITKPPEVMTIDLEPPPVVNWR